MDANAEFAAKMRTIRENIEWLLDAHPECRDDYRLLVHYYHYYIDGLKKFVPLEELKKLTQPESITRIFREIVNVKKQEKFQPTEIVQEARQMGEVQYHTYYSAQKRRAEAVW